MSVTPATNPSEALTLEVQRAFQEVLEAADIPLDKDIAALGGDSLNAVEIAMLIEDRTGAAVPIGLFETEGSVMGIARYIASTRASEA